MAQCIKTVDNLRHICLSAAFSILFLLSAKPVFADINPSLSSIESEFNVVVDDVEAKLLHAPEASKVYLDYWIKIYNGLAAEENKPHFKKRQSSQTYNSRIKNSNTGQTGWVPNGTPIISPNWRYQTPLSFNPANKFRAPTPPDIKSTQFQNDLSEVLRLGENYSEYRTAEQSIMAAFWADGLGTPTPPGRWNLIALQESRHLDRFERAKLMLALNIALYDTGIAAWDSKYHYLYWRPNTAIKKLDPENYSWQSMLASPFHPEYVSGHSAFSGAASTVLEYILGSKPFCITSEELLGLERCFSSFDQAAKEAGRSRVYGGIHFDFSNHEGQKLGRQVAQNVMSRFKNYLP